VAGGGLDIADFFYAGGIAIGIDCNAHQLADKHSITAAGGKKRAADTGKPFKIAP
jgi:hypothetical protein